MLLPTNQREEVPPVEIAPEVLESLSRHTWPGNVRELRNTLERMIILSDGVRLTAADVPFEGAAPAPAGGDDSGLLETPTFEEFKERSERAYLRHQLARNAWNVQKTAKELAMQRSNLYKKIEKYGLARDDAPGQSG